MKLKVPTRHRHTWELVQNEATNAWTRRCSTCGKFKVVPRSVLKDNDHGDSVPFA